jgi:hypothetical protein
MHLAKGSNTQDLLEDLYGSVVSMYYYYGDGSPCDKKSSEYQTATNMTAGLGDRRHSVESVPSLDCCELCLLTLAQHQLGPTTGHNMHHLLV